MSSQKGRHPSSQGGKRVRTSPTTKGNMDAKRGKKEVKKSLFASFSTSKYAPLYRFLGGLVLLFVTLFLLISSFSYLLTASKDQSVLSNHETFFSAIRETNKISNIGGLLGAYVSDWLVNRFLGIGSIVLLFFPLCYALRIFNLPKSNKISVVKIFFITAFSSIWLAILSTYVTILFDITLPFQIGGSQGVHLTLFLLTHLGHAGIVSLILFALIVIVVSVSQQSALWLQNFLSFSWLNIRIKRKAFPADRDVAMEEVAQVSVGEDRVEQAMEEEAKTNLQEERQETVVELGHSMPHAQIATKPEEEQQDSMTATATSSLIIEIPQEEEQQEYAPQSATSSRGDLELPNYVFPSLDLLEIYERGDNTPDYEEIASNERQIIETLESFKIKARPTKATVGPTVTLYEIEPDAGIKISRIRNLDDDIALSLKSEGGIRIIAPIPGKGTIGIEVPNKRPQIVSFHSLLSSRKFAENKMELPIAIGKTITNEVFMFDLTKMPHLLIAGATGQGKSVGLNVMISSLLYSKHPSELKFVMIDPKMLEFSVYEMLERHYLAKLPEEDKCIITDMSKVVPTLNSLCVEMDNRYRLLTEARVRNIAEYNKRVQSGELAFSEHHKFLPYIVLIIDEFADLIMTSGKEVERPITRIAQKARAAGIHMVLATQRPTTDIITGTIKANFPARIAFKVFSATDSRTILDGPGANHLVGRGDMLFYQGKDMLRLQCALIDTPETQRIVDTISSQASFTTPYNLPEAPVEETDEGRVVSLDRKDALFEEVARMVVETQQGSTSKIQRHFEIGFNRAGRIMDQLEAAGIVAAQQGSKSREVLIPDLYALQNLLDSLK